MKHSLRQKNPLLKNRLYDAGGVVLILVFYGVTVLLVLFVLVIVALSIFLIIREVKKNKQRNTRE